MQLSWSPSSWQTKPLTQQVKYPDANALKDVLARLARLPPLVTSGEVETLKRHLAEAARGERFLLQGGDCAETFDDCRSEVIAAKLKILLKMSIILMHGSNRPVVRVGRLAGQYAKPRSADTETRNGQSLPSYRGDLINRRGFTLQDRTPHPDLLLRGYERAALTLNFVRALVQGGFTDFRHPEFWDLDFVNYPAESSQYRTMMDSVVHSVRFLETVAGQSLAEMLGRTEFCASHEGLHLDYEQAQTRQVPRRSGWYNLTTHFPWIGDRTRSLEGAHVEYFRGIANPVGVKVGPTLGPEELVELCRTLNPDNEPGRLTLIHRFGANRIESHLPKSIAAVKRAGQTVLWVCDPMHGNTITTAGGIKTRNFDDILGELQGAIDIHAQMGTILGGVHFELTGENVTECLGGARRLSEADLAKDYRSDVDPRLNYEQAMEVALLLARQMHRANH